MAEVVLRCCAVIGAGMTFISLVTCAIWGKPTWVLGVCDAHSLTVRVVFIYLGITPRLCL